MSTSPKKDASKPEGNGENIVEKHVPAAGGEPAAARLDIPVFTKGAEAPPVHLTREDVEKLLSENNERIMQANLKASLEISERVAKSVIENSMPQIEKRSAEISQTILSRKAKVSAVKNHGVNILTAVGVFAVGSLAKMGYDRYSSKSNGNTNQQ